MKNILYAFQEHKKINGTLFYCFEYFVFLKERDPSVVFNIYKITAQDLDMIKDVFVSRYNFNCKILNDILPVNNIRDLAKLKNIKTLILDVNTLRQSYIFIKNDIICYANKGYQKIQSKDKEISYFGYYNYQNYGHKCRLKFYFDIYKKFETSLPQVFISCLNSKLDIVLPISLQSKKSFRKLFDRSYTLFFQSFDTLYYYHCGILDSNNRLIPECFFYNKNIIIDYNGNYDDSVYLRYTDILENGLAGYTLTDDDFMSNAFLGR